MSLNLASSRFPFWGQGRRCRGTCMGVGQGGASRPRRGSMKNTRSTEAVKAGHACTASHPGRLPATAYARFQAYNWLGAGHVIPPNVVGRLGLSGRHAPPRGGDTRPCPPAPAAASVALPVRRGSARWQDLPCWASIRLRYCAGCQPGGGTGRFQHGVEEARVLEGKPGRAGSGLVHGTPVVRCPPTPAAHAW